MQFADLHQMLALKLVLNQNPLHSIILIFSFMVNFQKLNISLIITQFNYLVFKYNQLAKHLHQ